MTASPDSGRSRTPDGTADPGVPRAVAVLLERLAEKLGGRASVRAVYGEPVTRGGVTVIPVARVTVGLGGGALRERGPTAPGGPVGETAGGGGGAWARPVGFIELRGDGATYRPLRSAWALLPAVAGALAGTLGAAGLVRAARAGRAVRRR